MLLLRVCVYLSALRMRSRRHLREARGRQGSNNMETKEGQEIHVRVEKDREKRQRGNTHSHQNTIIEYTAPYIHTAS